MPDRSKVVRVDPLHPDPPVISKAGNIILKNGVVIFPTRCLYGIGAPALNEAAVKKVFSIKRRPLDNPILVLIPGPDFLEDLVTHIPESAEKLMNAFWPGGLTLVFQARSDIPGPLTAGSGKLGIRIPSHPVARDLVKRVNIPITGTSANLSGRSGCSRIEDLDPDILRSSDLVLDAGQLMGGVGSTVVDVTLSPARVVREGTISARDIRRLLSNDPAQPPLFH